MAPKEKLNELIDRILHYFSLKNNHKFEGKWCVFENKGKFSFGEVTGESYNGNSIMIRSCTKPRHAKFFETVARKIEDVYICNDFDSAEKLFIEKTTDI